MDSTTKYFAMEWLQVFPSDREAIQRVLRGNYSRRQFWAEQFSEARFTLDLRARTVLHFLKKKKTARHCEIHRYLVSRGWAGFTWTSRPLEKLLVFGLIVREKRGRYTITKAGMRLDLFRAHYPIEYVNLDWLKHFLTHSW